MSTTVLLMPWGNGNGHVVRCLALAAGARERGFRTVVASMNERQTALIRSMGSEAVDYPGAVPDDPWTAWTEPAYVEAAIADDVSLLREVAPDLLVNDGRISANVAAHLESVRTVSLVQDMDFPGHRYPGRETEALWPAGARAFDAVLTAMGHPTRSGDLRSFIVSSPVLVPGVPETDEIPAAARHYARHVGPLTGSSLTRSARTAPPLAADALLFYRTFIEAVRADEFARAFGDLRDRVHVATGDPAVTSELRAHPALEGFRVETLWDFAPDGSTGPRHAVIHGGHGTMLSMLQAGVPSVVLGDDSPERAANAVKVRSFGSMASLATPSAGDWATQGAPNSTVPFADVRSALDELAGSPAVGAAADRWRGRLAEFTLERAVDAMVDEAAVPELVRR